MRKIHFKISILFLFVFLFLGQFRDSSNFSFYLSSSKIYSTNELPKIQVETYNYSGTIKFRAYRINNPIEYFENLNNPHYPDIKNLNTSNTFNILKTSFNKLKNDLRVSSRKILPEESRKILKNIFIKEDSLISKEETKISDDIPSALQNYEIEKEWIEKIPHNNDYWNYHTINIGINKPGVYLIEGKVANRKIAYTTLIISDYALITKNSNNKILTYVANKMTGQSIKDFPLSFYMDKKIISNNLNTNTNGLLEFEYPLAKSESNLEDFDPYSSNKYLIMGMKDDHFIISEPYISNYYYTYNKYNVFLYTERPVYRPGQTVYFKGIIRQKEKSEWIVYKNKYIPIKVTDSRGNTIFSDSILTNEFGTINGEIKIEKEFPLGYYWIESKIEGANYSTGFEVQEYKKPEYKVDITFDKKYYIKGEQLQAKIKANYYFGNPVANAKVEYFVYRKKLYYYNWDDFNFSFDDNEDYQFYGQELIFSQSAELNSDGEISFNYFTDKFANKDYLYTVVANVTDESRRVISSTRSVKVMRGSFSINISTDKFVYKKDDNIFFKINAEDFEKKPVMTNFNIKIFSISYERVEKTINNEKHVEYKKKKNLIHNLYGATNDKGESEISYKINQSGSFEIEIFAKDKNGNEISNIGYIYIIDNTDTDWYTSSSNNIKIIPDKKEYNKDDLMRIFITIPYPNSDVLITAERDEIYYSKVEHFNGISKVIEIPIKKEYSPNVFICASLLFNNDFYSQSKEISIPINEKILKVLIQNDKDIYKPGEKGKITIKAFDYKNRPVKNAELSLGIVDESIYDIVKDNTPDIVSQFYSKSPNQVYSSSSLYFSFYGYSREIRIDEYSDLYENKQKNLFASKNERERIAFGDVKGEKFAESKVRKDFKDMILWIPKLITNKDGIAEAIVNYPDNLTTWRSTVKAITKETEVGSSISRVITKKNLIVRLELPRFFISNDEAKIAINIHNYMNQDKYVNFQLSAKNIILLGSNQKVFVPKNSIVKIDYPVSTSGYFGNATFFAKVTTDNEYDAVELSVPILPHGIEKTETKNLVIEDQYSQKNFSFFIDENMNFYASKLIISNSPSVASSILGSLDELLDYPYGCVEQTMSRFLPALIVKKSIEDLGLPLTQRMQNDLPIIIDKSLKRLYAFQHNDNGGWGWWKDDQTDPYMTAYVVYGLALASELGYPIDKNSLRRGMWNLKWWIENQNDLELTTKSFLIFSLVSANKRENVFDPNLLKAYLNQIDKNKINNYSKALLALSYYTLEQKNEASFIVNNLISQTVYNNNEVFWKGKSWNYNWQDDEIETTAFVLKALINYNKNDSRIIKGLNYLLSKKNSDYWQSTKKTAMIILAITDYLKNSEELNTNYNLKIYVNDRKAFEKNFTKEDIFKKEDKIVIDHSYLRIGENKIRIEKNGKGKLYQTNRLMFYTNEENITMSGSDFIVHREYFKLRLINKGNNLIYIKEPLNGYLNSGDLIYVDLKVHSNISNDYFILEDPIPSGCEPVVEDQKFKIENENTNIYQNYRYWYNTARDFRDQKVTFFARKIFKGEQNYSYIMRAHIPGEFHTLPAQAFLMYYPEVRGNSNEKIIRIE